MKDKNVEDMDESELRKELKKLYKKINDLSDKDMEELSFDAKMKMKKKNADGEVVETREKAI